MVMRMSKQVQVIFNQKQLKNVKFFMAKAEFKKKIIFLTSKVDLNLSKKLAKSYIWSRTLYGAET